MRFGIWRPILGLIQGGASGVPDMAWRAEWSLQRPSALSRPQMLQVYLALSLAFILIACVLWYLGASHVMPFVAAALAALSLGLLFNIRHASDRDLIAMNPSLVRVEQHRAGHVRRTDFHPRWVRVEPDQHDGSLVRLSGQGRSVVVGEYVPRDGRPQLAEEFRWALRHLDD
ncbi:MAG: DUF2244 domain-containing protein [Aquabacterium sp.]